MLLNPNFDQNYWSRTAEGIYKIGHGSSGHGSSGHG